MNVAYVRVSTAEQNEARQVEALKPHNIEKWFTEKISGKNAARPQLQMMLDFVREGDTIYIHDLSRLARSTQDLLNIMDTLQSKNVMLISNKESIDTSTPTGKLIITFLAAINEFERANILERQREGIAIARARGRYCGRNRTPMPDNIMELHDRFSCRELKKTEIARMLNVTRPTLDKLFKEYEKQQEQAYLGDGLQADTAAEAE